ncbi:MAG TPA: hypothetical protein VK738_13250 [Terriglobales bacterium]|jgi:hypothetical protein|nr:hypothetical protein [Terriglobales bacterium]
MIKAGSGRVLIIALLFLVACVTGIALLLTQPVWAVHHASAAPAVDPERLRKHVTELSETLAPRDYTHVENLDRAAAYIHEQFRLAGGAVSEQAFVVDSQHYRNVIARFGKNSGSKDAERIVVGAHYDVCGPFRGRMIMPAALPD